MSLNRLCFIVLLLLALLSCSHRAEVFADIDSRLDTEAEAMLRRLDSMDVAAMSDDDRARHSILTAKARYRLHMPVGDDSTLHHAVAGLAAEGRCDSVTGYGLFIDGINRVRDNRITDGLASLHRAYSIGLELGNHRLAALAARELSTSMSAIHFFHESRDWALTAQKEFVKAGRPDGARELDALIIEMTYWLKEDEKALSMCEQADTALLNRPELAYSSRIMRTKADALFDLERYDEALAVLDTIEARSIDTTAYHWNSRAEVLIAMGRTDEAARALEKAAAIMYKPSDSAYYYDNVTDLLAAQGDYRTAYRRMKAVEEDDDVMSANDKLLYPGNALINFYSSREQSQRRDLSLTRTVALLAWCLAGVLALALIALVVAFVRRRRRMRDERISLQTTISELQRYITESGIDPENPDEIPDTFNIDTINNLCTALSIVGNLPMAKNAVKTRDGRKLVDISDFYSGPLFMKALEDTLNRRRNGWVATLRERYPEIPDPTIALATLLYLGLSTEAIAFITGSKSAESIYTKKSRLKEMILRQPEYAQKYLSDLRMVTA